MLSAIVMLLGILAADDGLSLAKKAALFETDMNRRFTIDGQVACKMILPSPAHPDLTFNMPDNAYMTGIVCGAKAMKYAVTRDPADRSAVSDALKALNLLSTISGKKGLLVRSAWPIDKPLDDAAKWHESADGKYHWLGDVSSDQMTGVVFGYALAYDLAANEEEKKTIAKNTTDLVDHVMENGMHIIDIDGKPTRFGNYAPQFVRLFEKMNALLWLQHLKVAHHVTGDPRLESEYRRFATQEGYAELTVDARSSFLGRVNFSDDVLLFLAYYPLLKYETDPALRELYLKSLRQTWLGAGKTPGAKAQGNPFYAFVARELLGDDSGVAAGINALKWFPLDIKWNRNTIAAYEKEFGFTFDPAPRSPEPKAGEAIPLDRRVKDWSVWVQDPFRAPGDRTKDFALEFNGHDYLVAYWMGRQAGVITPEM